MTAVLVGGVYIWH